MKIFTIVTEFDGLVNEVKTSHIISDVREFLSKELTSRFRPIEETDSIESYYEAYRDHVRENMDNSDDELLSLTVVDLPLVYETEADFDTSPWHAPGEGPRAFVNYYDCPNCDHKWTDVFESQPDEDCPVCGHRHCSPVYSS